MGSIGRLNDDDRRIFPLRTPHSPKNNRNKPTPASFRFFSSALVRLRDETSPMKRLLFTTCTQEPTRLNDDKLTQVQCAYRPCPCSK